MKYKLQYEITFNKIKLVILNSLQVFSIKLFYFTKLFILKYFSE